MDTRKITQSDHLNYVVYKKNETVKLKNFDEEEISLFFPDDQLAIKDFHLGFEDCLNQKLINRREERNNNKTQGQVKYN